MDVLTPGSPPATSGHEIPFFFPGEGGTSLFGVVTIPPSRPRGIGILVIPGGGVAGSTYRNDMAVHMCRRFAGLGFHAMRFDWHGVADSTGWVPRFNPEKPFVDDVLSATAALTAMGVDRLLIVGSCFGARTGLSAAGRIPGLEAMLLVSPPVAVRRRRDPGARMADQWSVVEAVRRGLRPSVLRGLRDPRRRRTFVQFWRAKGRSMRGGNARENALEQSTTWLSERFIASLQRACEAQIAVHLLYGERDGYLIDFTAARRDGRLASFLDNRQVVVEVISGEVHGYQRVPAQEEVSTKASAWVMDYAARFPDSPRRREGGARHLDMGEAAPPPDIGGLKPSLGAADA